MTDFNITPIEGSTPPISTPPVESAWLRLYKKFFNARILKWLILLALFLMVVSVISFWIGRPSFSDKDVQLTIEGPTQGAVGDEIVYKVKYGNSTKLDLRDLRFIFFYPPQSIVIKDGKIQEELSESFSIDKLRPGERAEKEFRAYLGGDRGNIKTAKTTLFFKAGTLRSSFEKSAELSTTIISQPVALSLVAPPNFVSGQSVNYILDYRNESSSDISDLRFEIIYPEGFTSQTATPNPSSGNNTWDIPVLLRGQGGRISIQGSLSGNESDTKIITAILHRKLNDQYVPYERATATTLISSPLLSIDVTVNDQKDYVANAGDRLRYSVTYKNLSKETLTGLSLSAKLEGSMYDFSTLTLEKGFYEDGSSTIIWDSGAVPEFGSLAPNKQGRISFSITLKKNFPPDASGSKDYFVKITNKLGTTIIPQGITADEIFSATSLITKITSSPSFKQAARYNDSAFGSSGPFPPKVGQTTFFTIRWTVTNPGNAIQNSKVVATLPTGVKWENKHQAELGNISYNQNRSEVTWDLNTIPAGGSSSKSQYEGVFQVSITPSSNQLGTAVELITNAQFTGQDSFTREDLLIRAQTLKTNNLADKEGGNVQQ